MKQDKAPEEWEANDHIENLKQSIGKDGVCPEHDNTVRALMWMIRRLSLTPTTSLSFLGVRANGYYAVRVLVLAVIFVLVLDGIGFVDLHFIREVVTEGAGGG